MPDKKTLLSNGIYDFSIKVRKEYEKAFNEKISSDKCKWNQLY